jgi:hypothetical protein
MIRYSSKHAVKGQQELEKERHKLSSHVDSSRGFAMFSGRSSHCITLAFKFFMLTLPYFPRSLQTPHTSYALFNPYAF